MSDPSKPQVPLSGTFYGERVGAVEQARIDAQRGTAGAVNAVASPRRTVLGDSGGHIAPANPPVRLPSALIEYVARLVGEVMDSEYDPTAAGREQAIAFVVNKLREVDVAQLKA